MEWISTKDRLPEEGEKVLTLGFFNENSAPEYRIDYIICFENATPPILWSYTLSDEFEKVLYWMPLPKPPESNYGKK